SETTVQIGGNPPMNAAPDSAFIKTVGSAPDNTQESSVTQVMVGVQCGPGGLRDDNTYDITLQLTPIYRPSLAQIKSTNDAYNNNVAKYNEQTKQAYQQALFES